MSQVANLNWWDNFNWGECEQAPTSLMAMEIVYTHVPIRTCPTVKLHMHESDMNRHVSFFALNPKFYYNNIIILTMCYKLASDRETRLQGLAGAETVSGDNG